MTSKNKKIALFIVLAVLFISLVYLTSNHSSTYYAKKFMILDSSYLKGVIVEIQDQTRDENFKLNTSNHKYIIKSITNTELNRNTFFGSIAEIGDSIYKEAYADTLYLFKQNGEEYAFEFH